MAEAETAAEPAPAPQLASDDEEIDDAATAAKAAAMTAVATTTTTAAATGERAAAGSTDAGEAAGEAASEMGVGVVATGERRAEPVGEGKRQAVLATRADVKIIGIEDEVAACESSQAGAPSWAVAPSQARAGVQCEGRCADGRRCGVWSVGSSAPSWVSEPLRSGGRHCTTHEPRRAAARAAKVAEKAAAQAAARRQHTARGVQRATGARRTAARDSGTAGMAAALMAAARGK